MTKLSKILRIVAAAAFLTALAVNVKVTLTDPFVGMSQEAIATGTDSGSSGGSGANWFRIDDITRKLDTLYTTSIGCPPGEVKNCSVTTVTTKTTCLPDGGQTCSSGTTSKTETYCGNCFSE